MLAAVLGKSRLHQPVGEGACLACHGPHGSKDRGLPRGALAATCGACHGDTMALLQRSRVKHAPMREGQCTRCHDPHSSDVPLLLVSPDPVQLCRACHRLEGHIHRPSGWKDPRNPNLVVECDSCHWSHGTEYPILLPYPKADQICARCHAAYKQ